MSWCSSALALLVLAVSRMFEVTVRVPALPRVPERSARCDPLLSMTTDAETPMLAWVMALAKPERVLSEAGTSMVCVAPLPTWMAMEPVSVSPPLAIESRVAVEATAPAPVMESASIPAVTVEFSRVSLVATMLEFTVNAPVDPEVCDRSESVDCVPLVTTVAVTPVPAARMLGVTVSVPALPELPDVRVRVSTPLAVVTLAVNPRPDALLIAEAIPESVL